MRATALTEPGPVDWPLPTIAATPADRSSTEADPRTTWTERRGPVTASFVACTVTQHPGWVVAGVGFSVVALATGGLGVAVLAGVLPDGAIAGLGSLEGLDAVHVGGTFLVIGSMSASGAIASFYEASGTRNGS